MQNSKYYRLPKIAHARRIYSNNMHEVAAWAGGEVIKANTSTGITAYFGFGKHEEVVSVPTLDGYISATVGEWLVREESDGVYFTLTDEEFNETYRSERYATLEQAMLDMAKERQATSLDDIAKELYKISSFARGHGEELGTPIERYFEVKDGDKWYTVTIQETPEEPTE